MKKQVSEGRRIFSDILIALQRIIVIWYYLDAPSKGITRLFSAKLFRRLVP